MLRQVNTKLLERFVRKPCLAIVPSLLVAVVAVVALLSSSPAVRVTSSFGSVEVKGDVDRQLKTMLVMSDSRKLSQYDYHQLAYAINRYYARRHGYLIRYFHAPCLNMPNEHQKNAIASPDPNFATKTCIACVHPKLGKRAAPWCKIVAVNDTMHRYSSEVDRIVYIDSDAFVNDLDSPLKEEYFDNTLGMYWNYPHSGVCTGIQFWQNTPLGREMIAAWWNSQTAFNTRHDYEQSVFSHENTTIRQWQYLSQIRVIKEDVREYNREISEDQEPRPFFRHITKKKDNARIDRMEAFIERHNVTRYYDGDDE